MAFVLSLEQKDQALTRTLKSESVIVAFDSEQVALSW